MNQDGVQRIMLMQDQVQQVNDQAFKIQNDKKQKGPGLKPGPFIYTSKFLAN